MRVIPRWLIAGLCLIPVALSAQDRQLTPDEILRLVRLSYTLHDQDFEARLRKDFKYVPFRLSLKPNYIRFVFANPAQALHLDTSGSKLVLREVVEGSNAPVAPDQYGKSIRGTDITYEDLAMRFLYWPNPRILGEDKIKTRPAWKLEMDNPDQYGPYGKVLVWIDQASGGLLKMEGYKWDGTLGKEFEVSHGKKMGDVWIADVIRVRSWDDGSKEGTTWLEITDLKE